MARHAHSELIALVRYCRLAGTFANNEPCHPRIWERQLMLETCSRRTFLQTCGAVAASALVGTAPAISALNASGSEKRWFKGNLHMHNQWSDGDPLPEWAVDWYKSHGYHFICPSDHNIFQAEDLRFDGFGFENEPADLAAFRGETSLWKVISPEPDWPKLTQAAWTRRWTNSAKTRSVP